MRHWSSFIDALFAAFFSLLPQHKSYEQVPTIDQADLSDPIAVREAHAQADREAWVAIAATRLLREQVRQCYMREGVNHMKNCKELVQVPPDPPRPAYSWLLTRVLLPSGVLSPHPGWQRRLPRLGQAGASHCGGCQSPRAHVDSQNHPTR